MLSELETTEGSTPKEREEERMRLMIIMLMCMEIPKDREAIAKSLNSYYKRNITAGVEKICSKVIKLK